MRQHLLRTIFSLAVLLSARANAQTPVDISFQRDPVQVQTGGGIQFTVITVPNVFTMTWLYQSGATLGLWVNNAPVVNDVPQFQGRVTITATTLQIRSAVLTDAGQYTVEVDPAVSTGLGKNSKSVTLQVYDPVTGVNLYVPPVAIEGKNISLTCTYQSGTEVTFLWTKGDTTLASSSRITISGGSLIINPGERADAGEYTCTVSNPVSSSSAKQTLTVYYGPDTPVLTKDTTKDCVGAGDVWAGKTITLTCTASSLPRAQFSWQFDGQAISSPDTGQLILQTSSTSQSGRYACTARNSVTGLTSEQATDLVVTDVCLDVGEVVGVVIGSFILLILLIILIILLIRYILVRRRRQEASAVQKNDANPRPIPENPPANVGRDLAQGPQPPPLYHTNHVYTPPVPERNEDVHRQNRNTQNISARPLHNGNLLTNGRQHNAIQNSINRTPHSGFENQAFALDELQTAPQQPMHNPDIVIQTGNAQVRLNTLQQAAQQGNNGQIPTIHVNLNSHSGDQQTPMESSGPPVASTTVDEATQTPQNTRRAASTLRTPMLDRHRAILQADPGQIPTGYTHYNQNNIVERNSNIDMEVYNQRSEPRGRSDSRSSQPASRHQGDSYNNRNNIIERNSNIDMEVYNQRSEPRGRSDSRSSQPASRHQRDTQYNRNNIEERNSHTEMYNQQSEPRRRADSRSSQPASQRQQPWDTLRGTPSYPNNQRNLYSDTTDYTTHPPLPQARSRSRERNERPRERENRRPSREREVESQPRSERRSSPREERRGRGESRAPRQEGSRDNSPRALPLMSQPSPTGRWQNQPDTRALVDPNHLPQSQASQQFREVPQTSNRAPQVNQAANQTLQNVRPTVQMPQSNRPANQTPQSNHVANQIPQTRQTERPQSQLTQQALQAHTERAQTFQNRRQQTQAALLHPGPQGTRPPTPPPVIPLQQFQALPKERTRQREVRPPVNMPVAQRPHHGHHRQHTAAMPQSHHHHHHQGHHHTGHRPTQAQTWQQQAHRGRPR
ncbi:hypothetical protein NL108_005491 [Boleophthalmus pectinirostris]|nr:hypothetical protein NL108_005491 [Boleophthalmus pectinirostris]